MFRIRRLRFLRFIQRIAAKDRSRTADRHLGVILAFIAGAINAVGFMAVGIYTSHMTGIVSTMSSSLVRDNGAVAWTLIGFLICFMVGSITSTIIVNFASNRKYHSEFAIPLMLEALLLILFGLAAEGFFSKSDITDNIIELLSFIMGLQNALITKMSQRAVRTTHVTGIATDMAVEIGRYISRIFNKSVPYEAYRLRLNSQLLFGFVLGGVAGAASFQHIAFATTIPLSFILIIIAVAPIWNDITDETVPDTRILQA